MKKRSFRIYLLLTRLGTAGIFLPSAMPAAASNAASGGVLASRGVLLPRGGDYEAWVWHITEVK